MYSFQAPLKRSVGVVLFDGGIVVVRVWLGQRRATIVTLQPGTCATANHVLLVTELQCATTDFFKPSLLVNHCWPAGPVMSLFVRVHIYL
jgi:hypothetical protein